MEWNGRVACCLFLLWTKFENEMLQIGPGLFYEAFLVKMETRNRVVGTLNRIIRCDQSNFVGKISLHIAVEM